MARREIERASVEEELRAALAAREELGAKFEPALVESSLGLAIPLTGAAGGAAGVAGIPIVWIGIVFVNLAFATMRLVNKLVR